MGKANKKVAKKLSSAGKGSEKELHLVGNRIKQLRIKAGYTSYETFAFENDIHRAQFGRYENGTDLRLSSLFRVLKALGVSPKEFFSEGFEKL
jgi:transcriptional regulator with XRE-family HTH domain